MERESGDQILSIDNLQFEGINSPLSFILNKNDKVVLYSKDSKISTKFYEVINGLISSEGSFSWGSTIKTSYLPLHNDHYFNENNRFRVAFKCSIYNFAKFIGHPVMYTRDGGIHLLTFSASTRNRKTGFHDKLGDSGKINRDVIQFKVGGRNNGDEVY